jgi:hypothetical protein
MVSDKSAAQIASQKIIFAHRMTDDKDQAADIIAQFFLADERLALAQ